LALYETVAQYRKEMLTLITSCHQAR